MLNFSFGEPSVSEQQPIVQPQPSVITRVTSKVNSWKDKLTYFGLGFAGGALTAYILLPKPLASQPVPTVALSPDTVVLGGIVTAQFYNVPSGAKVYSVVYQLVAGDLQFSTFEVPVELTTGLPTLQIQAQSPLFHAGVFPVWAYDDAGNLYMAWFTVT